MDYQKAIEYHTQIQLERKIAEIEYYGGFAGQTKTIEAVNEACIVACEAMRELQDIKSQMDDNLQDHISELRQAKFDIERFWEEPTALSKALQNAIRALVEIQQYKQLGSLDEVRAAVELRKPKAPNWHMNPVYENGKLPICPTCNTIMMRTEILGRTIDEHCVTCGQAIDWSDEE